MMLIDGGDQLRTAMGISHSKKAEAVVIRNHPQFRIPMPAMGESMLKIREKRQDAFMHSMEEINRLLDTGFFEVGYVRQEAFSLASDLSNVVVNDRDNTSPMDALIIACAIVDNECDRFCTSDIALLANPEVSEIASDYRSMRGIEDIKIDDFGTILSISAKRSRKR